MVPNEKIRDPSLHITFAQAGTTDDCAIKSFTRKGGSVMSCNTTSCCRSFSTGVRYSKGDFWPRGQANMPVVTYGWRFQCIQSQRCNHMPIVFYARDGFTCYELA